MTNGEKPRSEPEIIPPNEQVGRPGRDEPRVRVFVGRQGTRRIYIAKPGTFGTVLMVLIAAILMAVLLLVLSAAFFFLLPVAIVLAVIAVIAGLVRVFFGNAP
jgi:hypothetical protein